MHRLITRQLEGLALGIALTGFLPIALGQESSDIIVELQPSFHSLVGDEILVQNPGKPVIIEVAMHNKYDFEQPAVGMVDVRDAHGVTWYIAWQSTNLSPNGNYEMSVSWLPTDKGEYRVRTFAVSALPPGEVDVLSPVYESALLTVG